jgi:hypothetical protein
MREKYGWLVGDKRNEQAEHHAIHCAEIYFVVLKGVQGDNRYLPMLEGVKVLR